MKQKIRFILIGLVNSAIGFSIFTICFMLLQGLAHYLLVLGISHLLATSIGFYLMERFVFRQPKNLGKLDAYLKYQTTLITPFVINALVLPTLVEMAGLGVLLAQLLFSITWGFLSFYLHREYTFKSSRQGLSKN